MDAEQVLDCLATGYRLDLDGSTYVKQLVERAAPLMDGGLGVLAYTYDASDGEARVEHIAASDRFDFEWFRPFIAAIKNATGRAREPVGFRAWRHMTSGQASRIPAMKALLPHFAHLGGACDTFAINALDASGRGLWIGAPLRSTARIASGRMALGSRLAAHLTAAVRLRRGPVTKRAAVLAPGGEMLHAEADATIVASRDVLRHATLEFDRARSKQRRSDVDASTRRWRPLVSSRWSLLDDFDTDGRRFVVAVENRPPTRPLTTELSEREQQVVTHAHLGRTNKEIAYELGLAASTVRVLLHRAAVKMGVETREELIAKLDAMGPARH